MNNIEKVYNFGKPSVNFFAEKPFHLCTIFSHTKKFSDQNFF